MKDCFIIKNICKCIYYVGPGNFWYKPGEVREDNTKGYKAFSTVLFSVYSIVTILEFMAAIFGDFPADEQSDSVTFAVSHTIVMIKIFSVIRNKQVLKNLCRDMIRVCEPYEDPSKMSEKYRIVKINVIAYMISVYGSVLFFVFEGIRKLYAGRNFVTVVTYYPVSEDYSALANCFRVATTIVLCMMMLTMLLTVDSFTMINLIILKYKLITLRDYFYNLREKFEVINKADPRLAADDLANGLIEGVKMHRELLRLSKEILNVFETVITCQVCQSVGAAVSLLLQIALSNDLTFSASMKIIFFVIALFFLLALYLCNAGEITYQASLLSDAIFHCGWHIVPNPARHRRIGRVVLQAVALAQRPLVMKAYNILDLTYGTFIQVVRGTYSVFALIYARNK